VGGFRFDAITTLFEDPNLTDEDVLKDKDGKPYLNAYGDIALNDTRTNNLPRNHEVMQEMRAWTDTFGSNAFPGSRVLIGETYVPNIADLAAEYGTAEKPEFQLPMDTQVAFINKLDVAQFRARLADVETQIGDHTPLLLFDNHDNPRLDARYGDGVHDTDIQRALSTVLFASRGAALFYYGDEIGMKTTPPTRKEDVKDPIGVIGWPKEKGRDGERTPMQWDATAHAGFTAAGATPWLPVPPSAASINVEAEKSDPNSLLAWYQSLIRLKKANPAFAQGNDTMLDTANTKVLSWMRQAPGAPVVVVSVNFTAEPQTVYLSVPGSGGKTKTLLKTPGAPDPAWLGQFQLGPYGVYIGEVE
jgi:alpha-glucosidase